MDGWMVETHYILYNSVSLSTLFYLIVMSLFLFYGFIQILIYTAVLFCIFRCALQIHLKFQNNNKIDQCNIKYKIINKTTKNNFI